MITLVILFSFLLIFAFVVAVLMGILAVSPIVLLIIALPVLDILVFKLIFGKKRKNKTIRVMETWPFGF